MMKRSWIALTILALLATPLYAQSSLTNALSNLSSGVAVTGSDLFYDVQVVGKGGVKVTATQVKTFMLSNPTFTGTATFADSGTWGATGIVATTLSVGTLLTGTAITNIFAAPPPIGVTTPAAGTFTNLTATIALTAATANFNTLTVGSLTATNGNITAVNSLTATNANLTNLTSSFSAASTLATSPQGSFGQLTATNGSVTTLTSTNGWITSLTSTNGSIATLTGTSASFVTNTFTGQLISAGGLPSVFACGTSPTGAVSATSTNQSGSLKTGGTTLTSCGIGFSVPFTSSPKTCTIVAESSAAASDLTQTFVSALTAGGWTLSAVNTVNSATFGYICM